MLPSADQFTVHVDSYRESCVSLPGGSCVAGVAGFIDGDEFTLTNWHKASTTAGTHVFSITTTAMVSQIEIKYFRPMYKPGWLIKMNGVEVYRESANGGSDDLPSPVTHTYNLIPIDNGNPGNCTASLVHGTSCTPECNTGYTLSGSRSCDSGQLTDTAVCVELDHFCVDSTNRDTWGWVTHKPSTDNYGYISFDENPESWCADYDYVVLECPRLNDGGDLQAWCVNKTQMLAPPAANSDCNGGSLDQFCPGYGTDGVAVWNGIDLGGPYRGSAYKRDVFLTKLPGYVAPAPSPDPAPAPPPYVGTVTSRRLRVQVRRRQWKLLLESSNVDQQGGLSVWAGLPSQ